MHHEATMAMYEMLNRFGTLMRREIASYGDCETISSMAVFRRIFGNAKGGEPEMLRMTEISQRLMVSKSAATQAIDRLVERGMVERTDDPTDRRVVCVCPTESAQRAFSAQMEVNFSRTDRIIEHMGEESAHQLIALMGKFLDAISLEAEER